MNASTRTRLTAATILAATLIAPAALASDGFNKFPTQVRNVQTTMAGSVAVQPKLSAQFRSGATTIVRVPVRKRVIKRVVHPVSQQARYTATPQAERRFNKTSPVYGAVRTTMPVLFSERASTTR